MGRERLTHLREEVRDDEKRDRAEHGERDRPRLRVAVGAVDQVVDENPQRVEQDTDPEAVRWPPDARHEKRAPVDLGQSR